MTIKVKPWHRGGYQVEIYFRWPDGAQFRDRRVVDEKTEAQARKWGEKREQEIIAKGPPKPEVKGPAADERTCTEWFRDFHAWKESRGLETVRDMRGRADNWILNVIGPLTMRGVERGHIELIVRNLDAAIVRWQRGGGGRGKGKLSPKTAANVWGDLVHAFDEAVSSKETTLRVLDESPCAKVKGPEGGIERQAPILYSDELAKLWAGAPVEAGDKPVPLYRRRVYAFAFYAMARRSELAAITAPDVDTEHRTINIMKQTVGTSTKKEPTKSTKTKRARTIDIEAELWPLVEHLMANPEGTHGRLLRIPPSEDCAELLRKDLWTVGVRRPELHETDAMRINVTFHDLRDTGLTHMAVRGDPPILIQWRGGHTDFKMTQSYIDRGRIEARRIGTPFPPLPAELTGAAPAPAPKRRTKAEAKP